MGGGGGRREGPGSRVLRRAIPGARGLPPGGWGQAAHSPHWLMFMRKRGSWEPSALMQ